MGEDGEDIEALLQLVKCIPDATWPKGAYGSSAGVDVYPTEDVHLAPGERTAVTTGLAFAPPKGVYIRIAEKSGRALQDGLLIMGGVVDPDYQGEIKVILANIGKTYIHIPPSKAIAQIICEKIIFPKIKKVEYFLEETLQSKKAFGSTDENKVD